MYRKREVNKVNTILVKFGKAVGKVSIAILLFFVEIMLLLFWVTAFLIFIAGIVILGGLVIPYIRNNWILKEYNLPTIHKIVVILTVGTICSLTGFVAMKLLCRMNSKLIKIIIQA